MELIGKNIVPGTETIEGELKMPERRTIHNGRTDANARSRLVIIEHKKLSPKKGPAVPKLSTRLLMVESHRVDGSYDNILVVRLSRQTTLTERNKIEAGMTNTCEDLFFNNSWRDNGNFRINMKTRTNNCCCSDVLKCLEKVLETL